MNQPLTKHQLTIHEPQLTISWPLTNNNIGY